MLDRGRHLVLSRVSKTITGAHRRVAAHLCRNPLFTRSHLRISSRMQPYVHPPTYHPSPSATQRPLGRSRHGGQVVNYNILVGSEVGTRVGYNALEINELAGSTAIGVASFYHPRLPRTRPKKGRQTTTCPVDKDAKCDTNLAGTDGLDDH